jgi:hypothetical protein
VIAQVVDTHRAAAQWHRLTYAAASTCDLVAVSGYPYRRETILLDAEVLL